MAKKREMRSDSTLTSASVEVNQECCMLGNTLGWLLRHNVWIDSPEEEQLVSNAMLHSFLLAARNLCSFAYPGEKILPTDIIAADYFDSQQDWPELRPSVIPDLADGTFVRVVNKRLMHLTYDRATGTKPTWTCFGVAWELGKALEVFSKNVKESRRCDELVMSVAIFMRELRHTIELFGSVDQVTSVPLSTLWEESDFWTNPRVADAESGSAT